MAAIRTNPTLSDDLIGEILKRVPVKSLLRFQSVSKTWLSLIKHPAFVKSQLRHALATQTHQALIDHEKFSLVDVNSREIVAHLKFPHYPGVYIAYVKIVGSANGIVCVYCMHDINVWENDIYLWNPATRRCKHIPSFFNLSDDKLAFVVFGFGYDGVDDDFKVVKLCYPSLSVCLEVYSNNRNACRNRNVSEPIDVPRQTSFDVCIKGFLCGIGRYGMMTFDLNQEVLNCGIKLPVIDNAHAEMQLNCAIKLFDFTDAHDDDCYYDNDDVTRIIDFNDSVAVIMLMDSNKKINMWTLDDDACLRGGGVEASWTPMFSINLDMPEDLVHGYFSNGNLCLVLLRGNVPNDVKMMISCDADKRSRLPPFWLIWLIIITIV